MASAASRGPGSPSTAATCARAYPTPQALVAEGLAQIGLEQLGDAGGVVRAVNEALLPIRSSIAIRRRRARRLGGRRARLRAPLDDLECDAHVVKALEWLLARSWRPDESCYPEGLRLCRALAERGPAGFRRLLAEPLTTADLL
jgi:hypothetical protein